MRTREEAITDGKMLVESGDLIVQQYRDHYKARFDKDTILSDDDILAVVCMADDDDSPNGWADQMKAEEDRLELLTKPAQAAE